MLEKLTYKIIPLISVPKIHTDLLWDLTILFMGLAIVILTTVFYFRKKLTANSRKVREKKKELSPMVSEFIFYSTEASKEEKHIYIEHKILIRELLKNDFDRKVLTSILLDLRKDVSGETQKQLIHLYKNLGLHEDAYKKLKSWRWHIVAKGILELTQMQVTDSYQLVVRFINSKRSVIRKQAEIAIVSLKDEGISYFLDNTKYRISEWQQLVLLEVLRNNKGFEPPRFKAWLTAKNKHVVLLALRLIKHFKQNDAKASLIELLKHRNNQIKEEAIYCLKEFNVVEAVETLKLVFWRCSTDLKVMILGAIADLGDSGDIEFLEQIAHKKLHFSVKSKALNAINTIAPESIMPTKDIESTDNIIVPEDIIIETMTTESNEEQAVEKDMDTAREVSPEKNDALPFEVDFPIKEVISDENSNIEEPEEQLLDFLPIVMTSKEELEEGEVDVNLLEVVYSVIETTNKTEEEEEIVEDANNFTPGFIDCSISFLPIVVENDIDNVLSNEEKLFQESMIDFDLQYEEIDWEQEKMVIEEILEKNSDEAEKHVEEINSIKVIYEELNVDGKDNDAEEQFIKWPESQENRADDEPKEEEIEAIKSVIPKPFEFDEETSALIRLLADIEDFGDHREIPFLTNLLKEEYRPLIRERIRDVIYGIEKAIDSDDATPRHSIFEQLFEHCDKESKLILIDEMISIGDENEVNFLSKLINDSNDAVRRKAEMALKAIKERLSKVNIIKSDTAADDPQESQKYPLAQSNEDEDLLTFTDEFILEDQMNTGINQEVNSVSDTKMNNSIISQMISLPIKLLAKLNG
ncbi:MAG: hypothetical protein HKP49_03480 [Maribacter sp.]|nr:hypothetical protein [Maribacter sp.]